MTNIEGQPERRNIIVASLAVMVYFLAEGQFDGGVKIALVGIDFKNKEALVVFFWVMFLWFGLRYWQVNKAPAIHDISQELIKIEHSIIHEYIVCKLSDFPISIYTNKKFILHFYVQEEEWHVRDNQGNKRYKLSKKEKSIAKLLLYLYYSIYGSAINKHITPYVLFFIALFMGVNHFFQIPLILFLAFVTLWFVEYLHYISKKT